MPSILLVWTKCILSEKLNFWRQGLSYCVFFPQAGMEYYRRRYPSPVFIIVSDDMAWTRERFMISDVILLGEELLRFCLIVLAILFSRREQPWGGPGLACLLPPHPAWVRHLRTVGWGGGGRWGGGARVIEIIQRYSEPDSCTVLELDIVTGILILVLHPHLLTVKTNPNFYSMQLRFRVDIVVTANLPTPPHSQQTFKQLVD